jgi:hypothetical protein
MTSRFLHQDTEVCATLEFRSELNENLKQRNHGCGAENKKSENVRRKGNYPNSRPIPILANVVLTHDASKRR